jgi:ethanolamine ammonia-lyase small subunit
MRDLERTSAGSTLAARLRALTPARVGLARAGVSQQTRDVLSFQACHALARDAVHARFEAAALATGLGEKLDVPVIRLHSAATDRATYLQRPDLGRTLDEPSRALLSSQAAGSCELALIVADGLSALACERHVQPLLNELLPRLAAWRLGPVCVVEQGRVAIGDEIGGVLQAELSVVLIGERPGLSSPDSLGAYITWQPRVGRTDAERNCISNIRPEGLKYREAAEQLETCLKQARRRRLTGTALGERFLPWPETDREP